MKNDGCDKTQEMIDQWLEKTKHLKEDSTPSQMYGHMDQEQGVQGGPLGEDSAEPGTVWKPHTLYKGSHMLHVKGMFGATRPIMYRSHLEAQRIAKKVGGEIANYKGKYHILKHSLKEDLDGTGGTEAAGFQAQGGSEDKTNQVKTIKSVVRAKYQRKLIR